VFIANNLCLLFCKMSVIYIWSLSSHSVCIIACRYFTANTQWMYNWVKVFGIEFKVRHKCNEAPPKGCKYSSLFFYKWSTPNGVIPLSNCQDPPKAALQHPPCIKPFKRFTYKIRCPGRGNSFVAPNHYSFVPCKGASLFVLQFVKIYLSSYSCGSSRYSSLMPF
jgi:hypothetical protein